ncbi:transposase [Microvirga sp. M8]|nr:transposase [Microvirga tunisiensis]
MPKSRFTREFQDEAVRLVLTSGRSQRAIADDLGVNRSTLARWMAEHQDTRPSSGTPPHEDVMAELKRLRRENEVLRQERDILKKAVVGSSDERNSFGQRSSWRLKAKGFSWPSIEPERDRIQVALAMHGQV